MVVRSGPGPCLRSGPGPGLGPEPAHAFIVFPPLYYRICFLHLEQFHIEGAGNFPILCFLLTLGTSNDHFDIDILKKCKSNCSCQ